MGGPDSTRTLAALQNLGLRPEDLRLPGEEDGAEDTPEWRLQEKRRSRLIRSVEAERQLILAADSKNDTCDEVSRSVALAERLQLTGQMPRALAQPLALRDMKALRPKSAGDAASVSAGAAAKRLAKFQQKAREDVQKTIQAELEKVEIQVKRTEKEHLLEEKRKVLAAGLKKKKEEEVKQHEKAAARRIEKADKAEREREERQQLMEAKSEEKSRKVQAIKEQQLETRKREAAEKRRVIEETKIALVLENEQRKAEERELIWLKSQEKERILEENRRQQLSDIEERRARREEEFVAKMERVMRNEMANQQHREEVFWSGEAKNKDTIERRLALEGKVHDQVEKKNKTRDSRFARGAERCQSASASREGRFREVLADKDQRASAALERQRSEGNIGAAQVRQRKALWVSIANENRAQVRRAGQLRQARFLSKVASNIDRIEVKAFQEDHFQQQRLKALQQVWVEKEAFAATAEKLQYANSAARFAQLCNELGVEIPGKEAAEETPGSPKGEAPASPLF